MAWKQSHDRCAKLACNGWPTFDFHVFQAIQNIWNRRDSFPDISTILLFRQQVKKLPKTAKATQKRSPIKNTPKMAEDPVRLRLGENFSSLRLAIQESLAENPHPAQVPFSIASRFLKNLAKPRSVVDSVLAARERIE